MQRKATSFLREENRVSLATTVRPMKRRKCARELFHLPHRQEAKIKKVTPKDALNYSTSLEITRAKIALIITAC